MKMSSLRIVSCVLMSAFCLSCISLSYPEPIPEPPPPAKPPRVAPLNLDPPAETALSWSELTRAARDHRQRGEYSEAQERLAQAAFQVQPLPPTNAQRRTVFGIQARLAQILVDRGEIEAADELADQLFDQAEREPELGGSALVTLAQSVAGRRKKAALEAGEDPSQLALLRLALDTAQAGPTSRDRMDLGLIVAEAAYEEKDLDLARRGIDQAIQDSGRVIPAQRARIADLNMYQARIALEQGDLEVAETAATEANQIYAETDSATSLQGMAEALLAEVLAKRGDTEKAHVIALGAYARISLDESIHDSAQRRIVAAMARVERASGDLAAARLHFEEALAIPGVDFKPDQDLVTALAQELQDLQEPVESPDAPPIAPSSSAE